VNTKEKRFYQIASSSSILDGSSVSKDEGSSVDQGGEEGSAVAVEQEREQQAGEGEGGDGNEVVKPSDMITSTGAAAAAAEGTTTEAGLEGSSPIKEG